MRRPDHRDIAAIVTIIAAPYTLANAIASYLGYALPFGRVDTLGAAQRVAAASLSTAVLLALLLVALQTILSRLQLYGSTAIEFAWSVLAVLLGGVVLAAILLVLLHPALDIPELRHWRLPFILIAEVIWLLTGFLFYLGVGETE